MMDWSEAHVDLYPLSRKLQEQLNRREYHDAAITAMELEQKAFNIRMWLAKHIEDA